MRNETQSAWEPAATAPKTGEHILVTQLGLGGFGVCDEKQQQDWCAVVHYWPVAGEEGFYLSSGLGADESPVTFSHWMQLPSDTRRIPPWLKPQTPEATLATLTRRDVSLLTDIADGFSTVEHYDRLDDLRKRIRAIVERGEK